MFLFVYYKFVAQAYPRISEQLAELESAVRYRFPGIALRVLRRPDTDAAGQQTWMEMYEIRDQDLQALQTWLVDRVDQLGLPSKRAVEVFIAPDQ